MRRMGCLGMLWLLATIHAAALQAEQIVVLYNSSVAQSRELAEFYAAARSIPMANLVGLRMPEQAEINRQQYDETIARPLRRLFDERSWWRRVEDPNGVRLPVRNRIRVLLTVRGVPLKISQSPRADGQAHPDRKTQPFKGHDEASVDSELALLGVEGYPLEGAQQSRYFRSSKPIEKAGLPAMMLTCRIDAPSLKTCKRMISDGLAVEKSGLWGFHYIDISRKFPQGDNWLEGIVKQNLKHGLPTAIDRFASTIAPYYPARDMACYYGWYDWNLSGPMLNPEFRFRQGAVAVHIHSYSAQQLSNPKQNWSAGLLEAGAAVTLGNVYEPYLGLTHHLDVLHERLLEGHTWVEASWMAMPAVSWQAITLGDPLYRPFIHLDGKGKVLDADREYRALRAAMKRWGGDTGERIGQLKQAAVRMESGILLEAIALESLEAGNSEKAGTLFVQARELYTDATDRLRQDLQRVAMLRAGGQKDLALQRLRELAKAHGGLAEAKAIQAWIDQLDPPAKPE